MNKKDLIKKLGEDGPFPFKIAEIFLNKFVDVVTGELKKKEKIVLVGFGTFKSVHRAQRTGINPQNGQKITIPAKNVPVFSAGKSLKEKIK